MSTILDALRKARNTSPEAVVMDEEKVLTQRVEECPPLVSEAPREQLQLMKAVLAFAALVIVSMCVVLMFLLAKTLSPRMPVADGEEKGAQMAAVASPPVAGSGPVSQTSSVPPPVAGPDREPEPVRADVEVKSPGAVPPPTFPKAVGESEALPMIPVPPDEDALDETHVQVLKGLLDQQVAADKVRDSGANDVEPSLPEPAPKPRRDTGELTLDGIVYTEQNPVAMINGEVVPVGGTIGKARVTRILPDLVVLERDGKTIELRQK